VKSYSHFFKKIIWIVLFVLPAGCLVDQGKEEEIKAKARAGEYDEAARLAHEYLGDDKRILLVMLEYIAYEKNRGEKERYKEKLRVEDVNWSTDTSGVAKVVGRFVNRGKKTVTGIGVRFACMREGQAIHRKLATYSLEIQGNMSKAFQEKLDGFHDCDDISITVIDLGLKGEEMSANEQKD
jgi:hypothetical protein